MRFHFPKRLGARRCIDEPVLLARHGKAFPVALRAFGSGAATILLVVLLGRVARVGSPFAQAHVKPPFFVRIPSAFLRKSCPRTPGKTWAQVWLLGFLGGVRLGLDLLG